MVFKKGTRTLFVFLAFALITAGCLSTPAVNKETAGYLAGIRFLETHPSKTASYTVKDRGGDAYVVYFNITSPEGIQEEFAEYYVDKFTKDVYVSSTYATLLAVKGSPDLKKLFERYPNAKGEPNLIKTETPEGQKYIWEIRIIANGVDVAVFAFDALEEKLLQERIKSYQMVNIQTS